ncbi:hypothetical protein FAIPA1_10415 [Frankia sp. AiPs1]
MSPPALSPPALGSVTGSAAPRTGAPGPGEDGSGALSVDGTPTEAAVGGVGGGSGGVVGREPSSGAISVGSGAAGFGSADIVVVPLVRSSWS